MPKLAWNGKEICDWGCNERELKPKVNTSSSNTWIIDCSKAKSNINICHSNTSNICNAQIIFVA